LLTFFVDLPEAFVSFLEDRVAFRADAPEDFDPLWFEALARDVFFPLCFFEAVRESLPERPLVYFLPDRLFASFLPERPLVYFLPERPLEYFLPERPLEYFLPERPFDESVRERDFFFDDFPYFDFLPFPFLELFIQP